MADPDEGHGRGGAPYFSEIAHFLCAGIILIRIFVFKMADSEGAANIFILGRFELIAKNVFVFSVRPQASQAQKSSF